MAGSISRAERLIVLITSSNSLVTVASRTARDPAAAAATLSPVASPRDATSSRSSSAVTMSPSCASSRACDGSAAACHSGLCSISARRVSCWNRRCLSSRCNGSCSTTVRAMRTVAVVSGSSTIFAIHAASARTRSSSSSRLDVAGGDGVASQELRGGIGVGAGGKRSRASLSRGIDEAVASSVVCHVSPAPTRATWARCPGLAASLAIPAASSTASRAFDTSPAWRYAVARAMSRSTSAAGGRPASRSGREREGELLRGPLPVAVVARGSASSRCRAARNAGSSPVSVAGNKRSSSSICSCAPGRIPNSRAKTWRARSSAAERFGGPPGPTQGLDEQHPAVLVQGSAVTAASRSPMTVVGPSILRRSARSSSSVVVRRSVRRAHSERAWPQSARSSNGAIVHSDKAAARARRRSPSSFISDERAMSPATRSRSVVTVGPSA